MKLPTPTLPALALILAWTSAAAAADLPEGKGRDAVQRLCSGCHPIGTVTSQRHTGDEWDDIIARMVNHGLMATDQEQADVLDYLVKNYGPPASPPAKDVKSSHPSSH
jgi:cytochrome c5